MASNNPSPRHSQSPPQSIPLQNLSRPPDTDAGPSEGEHRGHTRGRSLMTGNAATRGPAVRYSRLDDSSPSPTLRVLLPSGQHMQPSVEDELSGGSPVENSHAFQMAVVGLSMPPSNQPLSPRGQDPYGPSYGRGDVGNSPYGPQSYGDMGDGYFNTTTDSDQVGLTDSNYLAPISGAPNPSTPRQSSDRDRTSFQSVRFDSPQTSRQSRLGDNLGSSPNGRSGGRERSRSFGKSLSPDSRRLSPSPSPSNAGPLTRAGSMMRAMSQRVVNFSNDAELPEPAYRRKDSADETLPNSGLPPILVTDEENMDYNPEMQQLPIEKVPSTPTAELPEEPAAPPWPITNPLRGNSLRIFAPDNYIRMRLCEFLVHPWTEPIILILIILQTVLLAVESSKDSFTNPMPNTWSGSPIDYAMLALFGIYTLEITAKIIVSGFFFNAEEYSTRTDVNQGLKTTFMSKYMTFFGPRRQQSVRVPRHLDAPPISEAISRTFTTAMKTPVAYPTTVEEQQRYQLARRAFFRHSLNRIDIVAVVAFWISVAIGITGVETRKHLYLFKMISCLRILRLLWLTNGTAIILKSLKKAAPLLVNVSFLIGFFWLLFAIVGVQAFKSSFSRTCTWVDPEGQSNYTNDFQLCGGHLDNISGVALPWTYDNGANGARASKGYLCPRGSLCIEGESLYNGTVSFDNIVNSLELVFVIMSANTFTDLMYYTTDSDYLAAALFFAAGIVIMLLWLTNLLIAVITSSFQVIREESKRSAFTMINTPVAVVEEVKPRSRSTVLKKLYTQSFWLWILVIMFGIVSQACRSASMSARRANFIFVAEIMVTFALDIEIFFRLASDFRKFPRSWKNGFDTLLAIVTTVILLPPIRNSGQPYAWLTVFQIVRVYRVVWAVPITRKLIEKMLGNATGILNLVLFVFLITFLISILAVQMFRGDIPAYDSNGNTVRTTFFSIWNAFLGLYQILSSENWTSILYNVQTYNDHHNTAWMGASFIIGWFILSYFILINMFIAVIQENFDVSEDEKRLEQVKAFLQKKDVSSSSSNLSLSTIFRFGKTKKTKDPLDYGQSTMEMLLKTSVVRDFLDDESGEPQPGLNTSHTFDNAPEIAPGSLSGLWGKFVTQVWHREPNPFYSTIRFTSAAEGLDPRTMAREAVSATALRKRAQRDYLNRHPSYNTAMFLFKPGNPIRRFCQRIVGPGRGAERIDGVEPNKIVWYTFSAFIYAAILTMVVLACVTTPLYQKEYFETHNFALRNWFVWTDMAFAVVFSVEAIIKMIADGCFWTPNAYFRSLWGFIDGWVLITLWINVITSFLNDGAISRAVGAFKALRALRLLHISDSARDTFHSVIFVAGWRVLSAIFVSLSLLIPFAIYGVNLFNGQMQVCNDGGSGIINLSDCVGEFNSSPFSSDWAFPAPRVPANPYYDFDNFGSSLFILFQIVSQEGWIDVMWSAQSIVGRGLQPRDFASQGNAVFFVVFNLMATVFVLTLFISVFMRTYTEQTGVAFLTAEQRSWMELRKLLRQVAPSKRPSTKSKPKWKDWCYKKAVQKHGLWSRTVTITLVLHLILLMIEYYPEPYWWTRTRDAVFLFFTVIYMANIVIRIVGLTWPRFRRSSWDLYSLVSVTGTMVTTILLFGKHDSVTLYQLHNIFLVSVALLLIPRNNALDQLFKTAAASLTSIGNLLATWLILFLVYAIAMTQTFGLTHFGSQGTNNLNFRDVPRALIVLFRMSVGEGWNQIMMDYANARPPLCVEGSTFFDSDCGSSSWAYALFISWNILSMYIFVSLFVSLIYESFSYVYQRSSGHEIVNRDETRRFKQAWATFDPDGTGYITKEEFPRLLGELSGIFAMRIYDEEDSVHRILEDVRTQPMGSRTTSVATTSGAMGIDLKKLNDRIARIDGNKVRERRHLYNIFYEEVMVSADPELGISFTSVLMILAHYNIISDNKSLKLDEFLRRRARLQRVEEEVHRRVVIGFFDTMYWARRFRRHLNRHSLSRITEISTFPVPEIFVEGDDDARSVALSADGDDTRRSMRATVDFSDGHASLRDMIGGLGMAGLHSRDGSVDSRGSRGAISGLGSGTSSPSRSPRLRPHRTNSSVSGAAMDLSDVVPARREGMHSRSGSTAGEMAVEAFNDSAWGASMRRSYTTRKSGDRRT
ncbi:hypothetical protein VF21_08442 [Pseudogymnoascus sp. 05NY08]|nr:hypothetical protein VF21_08442 [Pseudogymnoascus sp. 05NY08]